MTNSTSSSRATGSRRRGVYVRTTGGEPAALTEVRSPTSSFPKNSFTWDAGPLQLKPASASPPNVTHTTRGVSRCTRRTVTLKRGLRGREGGGAGSVGAFIGYPVEGLVRQRPRG